MMRRARRGRSGRLTAHSETEIPTVAGPKSPSGRSCRISAIPGRHRQDGSEPLYGSRQAGWEVRCGSSL